ncbi:MAG: DegT/DnrJ/EryC1/StrS family aminotransferase [Calditrichia bacterium]
MKIPITKTVLDEKEMAAIQEPLKTGWVVQGPYVKEFEDKFAEFTGAKDAIACTSCTTALHMAAAALHIQPGDEVIVPAFTWVATANVVEYMGGKVVFCDVDPQTFNIDPTKIEALITPKTRAIIPVHLFGLAADMNPILDIARRHNLGVIEDAACGFGAYYNGTHVGHIGDMGCFSFHPRKAITTGEGGMLLTNNADHAKLCRSLRDHGANKSDLARHTGKAAFLLSEFNVLGFNYRMTDMQGAMGIEQLKKAEWIQKQRTTRAKRYDELLADVDWLELPHVPDNCEHGYQSYVCLFQPEEITLENTAKLHDLRNDLMMRMEDIGISTRQGTHAVTLLGYYQKNYGISDTDFPNAFICDRLSLSLPLYAQMTDEEQDHVVSNMKAIAEDVLCAV